MVTVTVGETTEPEGEGEGVAELLVFAVPVAHEEKSSPLPTRKMMRVHDNGINGLSYWGYNMFAFFPKKVNFTKNSG